MAKDFDPTALILLGIGGYLVWNYHATGNWLPAFLQQTGTAPNQSATGSAAPATALVGMMCRTPSGALVPMNADGTCPGGAVPCYPTNFVGPVPSDGQYC